jgi:hypothetical protein
MIFFVDLPIVKADFQNLAHSEKMLAKLAEVTVKQMIKIDYLED